MTGVEREGAALRIFVLESDRWHGRPLYAAIVERARELGVGGATVLRGIEGFGASTRVHTSRILRLSEDLPIVVEIVDTAETVERLLGVLGDMIPEGMATVEKVRMIAFRSEDV